MTQFLKNDIDIYKTCHSTHPSASPTVQYPSPSIAFLQGRVTGSRDLGTKRPTKEPIGACLQWAYIRIKNPVLINTVLVDE